MKSTLKKYAYRICPQYMHRRSFKADLNYQWEKDSEENLETTLQEQDGIKLHFLWAVEFYTSSHAENLSTAFKNLGWDKDTQTANTDPVSWIERTRSRPHGGGWTTLGTLVPPDSKYFGVRTRKTKLPPHVKYASAHLFNLSSSINCVVLCFAYEDAHTAIFENALRAEYKSYIKIRTKSYSVKTPRFQKQDRTNALREELRQDVKSWLKEYIPGVFCSDEDRTFLPTCEFTTLKNITPFPHGKEKLPTWADILGYNRGWRSWEAIEFKGLKFSWSLLKEGEEDFHAAMAISEEDMKKIDFSSYGGPDNPNYFGFFDNRMSELMSRWACLALIGHYERKLCVSRDSKKYKVSQKDTLKLLDNISTLISESIDVVTFAPELIELADRKLLLTYGSNGFKHTTIQDPKDGDYLSFFDCLSKQIKMDAQRLLEVDKRIKELIIQQGNLLTASENIKIQKWLSFLTIITTILAAITAYETLKKISLADVSAGAAKAWTSIQDIIPF